MSGSGGWSPFQTLARVTLATHFLQDTRTGSPLFRLDLTSESSAPVHGVLSCSELRILTQVAHNVSRGQLSVMRLAQTLFFLLTTLLLPYNIVTILPLFYLHFIPKWRDTIMNQNKIILNLFIQCILYLAQIKCKELNYLNLKYCVFGKGCGMK